MIGETDLDVLLLSMEPVLGKVNYVFCTVKERIQDIIEFDPWAIVREDEGITVVVEEEKAKEKGIKFIGPFRCITLNVHSSLYAVGLTAVIATELAKNNISANVIAGYYHDHVFVEEGKAEEALSVLKILGRKS